MSAITGKSCSNYFSDTEKLKNALDTAITNFDNPNLDKQNIFLSFEKSKVKTLQKFGYLYSSHAYSIKSIDNGVATLKNPHNRQSYDLTVLPDDFFEKELKIQKIMLELLKFYIDPSIIAYVVEIKVNNNLDFKTIFQKLNIKALSVKYESQSELKKAFEEKFKNEESPIYAIKNKTNDATYNKIINKMWKQNIISINNNKDIYIVDKKEISEKINKKEFGFFKKDASLAQKIFYTLCQIAINKKSIDDKLTPDQLYEIIKSQYFTFQWQSFKYKKFVLSDKSLILKLLNNKREKKQPPA